MIVEHYSDLAEGRLPKIRAEQQVLGCCKI